MALCPPPSRTPASRRRPHGRPGLEIRLYQVHLIKKWSWIVFVVVLGSFPLASEGHPDVELEMEHLKASVESHGQSLRNMEHYLRKTNQFWNWYQSNYKRLNELLQDGPAPRSWSGVAPESLQLQMEAMMNSVKAQFEEELKSMREEMQAERAARSQLEDTLSQRINQQNRATSSLQKQIREQKEALQECQSSVRSLEENQVGANRSFDNIVMFVKNIAAETNKSLESMHDKYERLQDAAQVTPSGEGMVELNAEVGRLKDDIQRLQRATSSNERVLQESATKSDVDQRIQGLEGEFRRLSQKVDKQKSQSGGNTESRLTRLETQVGRLQGLESQIEPMQSNLEELRVQSQRREDLIKQETEKLRQEMEGKMSELETRINKPDPERPQDGEPARVPGNSLSASPKDVIYSGSYSRINFPSGPDSGPALPASPGTSGYHRAPGSGGTMDDYTGSRGEPGGPGEPGTPGRRGEPGWRGIPGRQGSAGARGSSGDYGARGLPGETGIRGAPGRLGDAGGRGQPGAPGRPGDAGGRGQPGDAGRRGLPGAPGYPGAPGAPGDWGIQGEPGYPGAPGLPGYSGYPGVPGPRGPPGPAG